MSGNKRDPSRAKPLRYVIQNCHGKRWHTVKSYDSNDWEFRIVERVMEKLVGRYTGHFRILIMPYNILAETTESAAS